MSRIIKTVSLDESSDELASKIPNFSKWVRNQLKLQDESFQNSHVTLGVYRKKGICNPSASPRCNICFPHGRPQITDIKDFNTGRISSEQLQEITKKKCNSLNQSKTLAISKKIEFGKEESTEKTISERKYLRRTLRYIWSFI